MTPTEQPQGQQQERAQAQTPLQLFGETLKSFVAERLEQEISAEKIIQYLRWRRADLYYRGIHHVYPEIKNGNLDLTGTGQPRMGASAQDEQSTYDYQFRVVQKYGELFVAVLGPRPVYNCHAVPDNPQSEADKAAARQADLGALILRSWWNVKRMNYQLAYQCYKSGTVYPYLRWVTDPRKWGTYKVPVMGQQEIQTAPAYFQCLNCGAQLSEEQASAVQFMCPQCAAPLGPETRHDPETATVPVQTDEQEYPNGRVDLRFHNATTIIHPFYCQEREDLPWIAKESGQPMGAMMARYPDLRDKIEQLAGATGSSVSGTGQLVRSGAQSQTGTSRSTSSQNQVVERVFWLTPEELELIKDKDQREQLKSAFPDGLRFVMIGELPAEVSNESFMDHLTFCQPVVGEYIAVDGICWAILGHQDLKNDFMGIMIETMERGLPTHIVEAGLLNVEAITSRRHRPQEIVETMPEAGRSLDGSIKTLSAARFPDQLPALASSIEEEVKGQVHMNDILWGGSDTTRKTAQQVDTELNQALAALGTTGANMAHVWVEIHDMGVKLLAQHAPDGLMHEGQLLDKEALMGGNYHFEAEPGIPRTYAERKDVIRTMLQDTTPSGQMAVSKFHLFDPINIKETGSFLDLPPDLENPDVNHKEMVDELIEQLLEDGREGRGPIRGPMGNEPSVQFPDFVLDPQMAVLQIHEYLLTKSARDQKKTNLDGYDNVIAFGMQAQQRLAPPPVNQPNSQQPSPEGEQSAPPPGAGQAPPAESTGEETQNG